jgi:hypothetical protein
VTLRRSFPEHWSTTRVFSEELKKMTRFVYIAALALLAIVPIDAQAPKGWLYRADRSTSASDPDAPGPIRFTTSGTGFLAINPQAAVYWTPSNTATGNYTREPREAAPRAVIAADRGPDAKGTSTNALEVRVLPDKIDYVVNGMVVNSTPKSGMTAKTDGLYGIRVNHRQVKVDNFGLSK